MSTLKFVQEKKAAIIGVPIKEGQDKVGVDEGPARLFEFGISDQLKCLGWAVKEEMIPVSDLKPKEDEPHHTLRNPRHVGAVNKTLATVVEGHARDGNIVVSVGGDHSMAVGSISGITAVHPNAVVVWVDAHSDINTTESSQSGNLHGCPVAFLLGLSGKEVPGFEWVKPCLNSSRIVYIGLRDIDDGERKILRDNHIKVYTMKDVDRHGIGNVVEMALNHVNPYRSLPIHLSFDIDGLDPTVAPSTGTPVRGGLTFREGCYICETLAETGLLVGVDITEINPKLGSERDAAVTLQVACSMTRYVSV
jgi:arginase